MHPSQENQAQGGRLISGCIPRLVSVFPRSVQGIWCLAFVLMSLAMITQLLRAEAWRDVAEKAIGVEQALLQYQPLSPLLSPKTPFFFQFFQIQEVQSDDE